MNFLFAWRYFKAKKSTNAINVIAWISIVAMMFGTAALILVLSVFNGFEGLVKSLYSSFYTDIKIIPDKGKTLVLTNDQLNRIRSHSLVSAVSLVAEEKALLQNGEYQTVVNLKGVDEAYTSVTTVDSFLVRGEFELGDADRPALVLGSGIENAIGIMAERQLYPLIVYLPRKSETELFDPSRNIAADSILTTGVFVIQQDFDNKYAITNLGFVKRMMEMGEDEYSGVELRLKDPSAVDEVQEDLEKILGSSYLVQSRYEQNRSLYSVMQAEKWVIYAVLCLILVVAAFNMIGALTMLVLEKERDINVLHALGANNNFIRKIFLSEGLLLALVGGGIGMFLAWLIAVLQIKFHLIPLTGGSFLIDHFPVELKLSDFILVSATVLVIALMASWVPANQAAKRSFSLRAE